MPSSALLQMESRPELWGKYAYVLNRLQGVLRESGLDMLAVSPLPSSASLTTLAQATARSGGCAGAGVGGASGGRSLPPTAIRMEDTHLGQLRGELLGQLLGLEASLADRKGPAGTAAGEVAFPKVGGGRHAWPPPPPPPHPLTQGCQVYLSACLATALPLPWLPCFFVRDVLLY